MNASSFKLILGNSTAEVHGIDWLPGCEMYVVRHRLNLMELGTMTFNKDGSPSKKSFKWKLVRT